MERLVLKLTMFHTLGLAVLSIYLGEWIRNKFPALKKYCLPGAVIGGTIVSIISLLLYNYNIVELSFDYKAANTLFYCIFFAASGGTVNKKWTQSLTNFMNFLFRIGLAKCNPMRNAFF